VQEIDTGAAKLDLTLSLADDGRRFVGRLTYGTELFHPSTAARLLRHLQALLAAGVAHPEVPLAELPILTDPERAQLLQEWNDTEESGPEPPPVHWQIAAQARRVPERPRHGWCRPGKPATAESGPPR